MEYKKNKKTTKEQQTSLLQVTPSPQLSPKEKEMSTLTKRDRQIQKAIEKQSKSVRSQ